MYYKLSNLIYRLVCFIEDIFIKLSKNKYNNNDD